MNVVVLLNKSAPRVFIVQGNDVHRYKFVVSSARFGAVRDFYQTLSDVIGHAVIAREDNSLVMHRKGIPIRSRPSTDTQKP